MELKQEFHYLHSLKNIDDKKREQLTQELIDVYKDITVQNEEKGKRASELIIANLELDFQTEEKKIGQPNW